MALCLYVYLSLLFSFFPRSFAPSCWPVLAPLVLMTKIGLVSSWDLNVGFFFIQHSLFGSLVTCRSDKKKLNEILKKNPYINSFAFRDRLIYMYMYINVKWVSEWVSEWEKERERERNDAGKLGGWFHLPLVELHRFELTNLIDIYSDLILLLHNRRKAEEEEEEQKEEKDSCELVGCWLLFVT